MSVVQPHAAARFEIPVRDLDRAEAFYTALLGAPLRREAMGDKTLAVFAYTEGGVGGCLMAGGGVPEPHLLDTHADAGLAPLFGTKACAHFYKWLAWLTNSLQSALIVYFYPERWADDAAAIAQIKARAEAKVGTLLDQLDAQLAERPWLLGAEFGALDLYTLVLCRWTRGFATRPARDCPRLGPYLQRLLARPAVQRVFARERLAAPLV